MIVFQEEDFDETISKFLARLLLLLNMIHRNSIGLGPKTRHQRRIATYSLSSKNQLMDLLKKSKILNYYTLESLSEFDEELIVFPGRRWISAHQNIIRACRLMDHSDYKVFGIQFILAAVALSIKYLFYN